MSSLPIGWRIVTLGAVADVRGGKRLPKGAAYSSTPTSHLYIRVVDFKNGSIATSDLKYLTPEVQRSISRYTIGKYDVYISIAGTIGLVGTIPEWLDGANLTENAAKLVVKDKILLDWRFFALLLSTRTCQNQIQLLTVKTSQPKLALSRSVAPI